MKRVWFVILFLFLTAGNKLSAQSDNRISGFNSFWENVYYINPAAIDDKYLWVASLVSRDQWTGFDGRPHSKLATVARFVEPMQSQFGLRAFTENIGFTRQMSTALSIARNIPISYDREIRLGLAAGYYKLSYNRDIITVQEDDPLINSLARHGNYYNFDFGVEYKIPRWKFGLSLKNIGSWFGLNKDSLGFLGNVNYLYGMWRRETKGVMDISVGGSVIHSGKSFQTLHSFLHTLQGEVNISGYFRMNDEKDDFAQIGIFYRSVSEVGVLLGIDLGDLDIFKSFNYIQSFRVLYSYDYNFRWISSAVWGTHEIVLLFKWKERECVNCPPPQKRFKKQKGMPFINY